jgi:hypothetical protein
MSQPMAGPHQHPVAEMLISGELSAEDRRLVNDAVVNSALEGWTPDAESLALLTELAAGNIDIAEYRHQVLTRAGVRQP